MTETKTYGPGVQKYIDEAKRLIAERDRVVGNLAERLTAFTERAIDADSALQRIVWLDAAADTIRRQPQHDRKAHFDRATRVVHAAYRIAKRERLAIVQGLAERIVPVG